MAEDETFGTIRTDYSPVGDVDNLASHVIAMLCERQAHTVSGARQFVLDYLLRTVLRRQEFDPALVLDELRGHRLTVDQVIDLYIPLAAQELGDMWIRSELDFAQVTISALRLQALLGEAAVEIIPVPGAESLDMSALVIVPAGEHHFLGASVVAAQLRRWGCNVAMSFCERDEQVLHRVIEDSPNMILITCARLEGLEVVGRIVRTVKSAVDPSPVLALGGAIRGDLAEMKKLTGVDLVSRDAKDVMGFCAKRLKALSER